MAHLWLQLLKKVLTSLVVLDKDYTMQVGVNTADTIISDTTTFLLLIFLFELILKIFYMCMKLPDLSMAAEYPASIFPIMHFECAVGWVRWVWLRALPSVILLFKNNAIFTSRYWIVTNMYFLHITRCKNPDRNFCLISQNFEIPSK